MTSASPVPAAPGATPAAPTSRPLDRAALRIAGVVVLGSIMSILDTTIVNVAIRTLSQEFHASLETTQWVATGYMLALATVIPLTGWAADRFGTKRLYMLSVVLFVLGSVLSGAAWSIGSLICFRVLQGLGGGMIMPAGMVILSHAAGQAGMGRIMSIIGVPMLLGPIAGPILGGWFVDDFSWRWIFYVNLPLGIVALVAALRVLPPDSAGSHHRLDWLGLFLLPPGLAIFVFGLARTAAAGRMDIPRNDLCLAVGCALIGAFILHSARRPGALIDVRLFTRPAPAAGAATSFLFAVAFFGMALLMPLYFQVVRAMPALGAGLLLAPQGLGAMIAMPVAGRLTDRQGPRRVVLTGLTLVVIGVAILSCLRTDTPPALIEIALFLNGAGMGSVMMPSMGAVMGSVERHEIARATGGINVLQRVGGSIGTALLTVILAHEIGRITGDPAQGLHGPVPTAAAPRLGDAFAQTMRWALAVLLLAYPAASRLPAGRPGRREPGAPSDDARPPPVDGRDCGTPAIATGEAITESM